MYELGRREALIKLGLDDFRHHVPAFMAAVGGLSGLGGARAEGLPLLGQALFGLGGTGLGYGAGKLIQRATTPRETPTPVTDATIKSELPYLQGLYNPEVNFADPNRQGEFSEAANWIKRHPEARPESKTAGIRSFIKNLAGSPPDVVHPHEAAQFMETLLGRGSLAEKAEHVERFRKRLETVPMKKASETIDTGMPLRRKSASVRWQDSIPGGLADVSQPSDFADAELARGIRVETEHTNEGHVAKEIAMDHLKEDPEYYTKLKKMEKGGMDAATLRLLLQEGVELGADAYLLNKNRAQQKKPEEPVKTAYTLAEALIGGGILGATGGAVGAPEGKRGRGALLGIAPGVGGALLPALAGIEHPAAVAAGAAGMGYGASRLARTMGDS
jgi:hypothetical protein